MVSVSFTFPAGRYHATPWDRHVNEAAVSWPPEPWRLVRTLIATWHHKVKATGQHDESTLRQLVASLASDQPVYTLPAASHTHVRHYMPGASTTSLVFDAFVAVSREDPLLVTWPNVTLPEGQSVLLDDLLAVIGYLGRAESWVEATRAALAPAPNCSPGDESLDSETGEVFGETTVLLSPLAEADYQQLRRGFLVDAKSRKKLASTLPDNLVDALSVDTSALRQLGWSQPPASRKVSYVRPVDALRPQRNVRREALPECDTVQYVLSGKPLPRVEDTLLVGELLRIALMGQAKRSYGEDGIPRALSGHDLPADNRHQHAFYLPWDSNGDGRIDRLLVHVPSGLDPSARRVAEQLRRLWRRDGVEWRVTLEGIGGRDVAAPLTQRAAVWTSVTPYLHPWHWKKRFTIEDQIRRECRERGLPDVTSLERLESVRVGNTPRRPIDFHRLRSKRGVQQPDRQGSFWRLTFAEPARGPVSLGFACHFGLGLFAPD